MAKVQLKYGFAVLNSLKDCGASVSELNALSLCHITIEVRYTFRVVAHVHTRRRCKWIVGWIIEWIVAVVVILCLSQACTPTAGYIFTIVTLKAAQARPTFVVVVAVSFAQSACARIISSPQWWPPDSLGADT